MTILGIAEATVASLVRAVTDPAHDRDAVAERFARATWTGIAEPGDRLAGLVVGAVGAEQALAALIADREGGALRQLVSACDGGLAGLGIDERDLDDAVARWAPRISQADALRALRQAARFAVQLVVPGDPDWPASSAISPSTPPSHSGFADVATHWLTSIAVWRSWVHARRPATAST
ncbi:hypothetical protein [Homoserinibacter gongjuensis]|uniref:DUF222 domain-containing protein n=1 Tax=Homoserinibacter gongjuensis TaxID=1162968 RepID=A0ABQ6JZ43_9MICO|nr:hypothetical protein [Homoserinibacter gongjuensis]GMA91851.1 hypothetical protein GCM10025869_23800 [Homoserinibacter gongjuensis]